MSNSSFLADREVIELLAEDPELLAIADAVAATQAAPAAPDLKRDVVRGSGRRRRVVVLAAAALLVAVASASAFGTVRNLFFGESKGVSLWAGDPSWSPDGHRIAFTTVVCAQWCNGPFEINVMNADGSGQRNLSREWGLEIQALGGGGGSPVWSPDWRKVAFVQVRGVNRAYPVGRYSDIYVMNTDGSGRRRLTRSPQDDGDPVWSPDGRKLAFVRVRGGRSDIYVVDADGRGLRRLAHAISFKPDANGPSSGFGANPAWSPDGRTIAFMSNRDGNDDVFVVNADGGGLRNLTPRREIDTRVWKGRKHERISWFSPDGPMWSPDGRRIVFRSERDRPSDSERAACRTRCWRDEIYVVGADGRGLRPLTDNWRTDGAPMWSPDGRKILFTRSSDVYVMNADGGGQRNLTRSATHPHATDTAAEWSPNGRQIVFVSNREDGGKGQVYVMNADGSSKRKLTEVNQEK